jgi:hypothetical protein
MKIIYSILLLMLLSSGLFAQNVEIVTRGVAVAQIVIPAKPTDIERAAAAQLRLYVQKMSGAWLKVVYDNELADKNEILIGRTSRYNDADFNTLDEDGVLVKTVNSKLVITGGKRKGVLYGVYTFLDKFLGYRKYTKDIEYIPSGKDIRVGSIAYKHNPSFAFRSVYSLDVLWYPEYADFQKTNYFFEGRGSSVHTFAQLLPADQYFKSHPEYFALVDGKRVNTQPCLSNPDVFRIMKSNLEAQMKAKPAARVWSVSHNDNLDYCHCSLCEPKHKAGNGYMETLMPFVNKMAQSFPGYTISTLAYNQSLIPPRQVKPLSNVEIMFCFTHINRVIPIVAAKDTGTVRFRNAMDRWRLLTKNIFVWDYPVNFFHSLAPFPNIPALQANLRYFKSKDVACVFEQLIGLQKGEMSELKGYLLSKLLWDIDENVALLEDDFLKGYYGAAAADIKNYLNLLEQQATGKNIFLDTWGNPVAYKDNFLSAANISQYKAFFARAADKVKDNKYTQNRVLKESLSVEYAELEIGRVDKSRFINGGGKSKYLQRLKDFTNKANTLGVLRLMNGERTPDEYMQGASVNIEAFIPK